MTDKEILIDMFRRRGITFSEDNNVSGNWIYVEAGYSGFYSQFKFVHGALVSVEAYE